jgi:uncharacterized membrane protein
MSEALSQLFAAVCGQNPDHTWAPGGWLLPCCQRCTGLYAGALAAALLLAWLRPRLSGRFLEVHGAFLLFMAPCGLHWIPQGPVSRTLSGLLFGFGLVAFLWLVPAERWARPATRAAAAPPGQAAAYAGGLALVMVAVPALAGAGDRAAAYALSFWSLGGLLVLGLLAAANLWLGLTRLLRLIRRPAPAHLPP